MATIKMNYMIQSCPVCGKRLLKVAQGATIIGSPLIKCKHCKRTYRTNLREEWVDYDHKWQFWVIPLLLPILLFVIGAIISDITIGICAGVFGLILGLGLFIKDGIRIIKSIRRMKNPAYLDELVKYGILSEGMRQFYLNGRK